MFLNNLKLLAATFQAKCLKFFVDQEAAASATEVVNLLLVMMVVVKVLAVTFFHFLIDFFYGT